MRIAVVGAGGRIGGFVAREALSRGHEVTAVVRDQSRVEIPDGAAVAEGDVTDEDGMAAAVAGHDAVVVSISGRNNEDPHVHAAAARTMLAALTRAGVSRLLWVGGAGSLELSPGLQVVDSPDFPAAARHEALGQREALGVFRSSRGPIEWSFFSPARTIGPGERTGRVRVEETDRVLTNGAGESFVSFSDYAAALVDELERPRFLRTRFSIATA